MTSTIDNDYDKQPVRNGLCYVQSQMCDSCIFWPTSPDKELIAQLVAYKRANHDAVRCHETFGDEGAYCRGFYDAYVEETPALGQAAETGKIVFVQNRGKQ